MVGAAVTSIRVVLVDGHPAYRESLRFLLECEPNVSVVAEAGNGNEAIEIVDQHQPDVVVIDVRLPLLDGLEATKIISGKYPDIRVIVQSLFNDDGVRVKAIEAGACEYIPKDGPFHDLVAAIRDGLHPSLKDALSDVTRSLAKDRDAVVVTEISGPVKAYEVMVSVADHNVILSKISTIKMIAMRFASVPETESVIINLVVRDPRLSLEN